MTRQKGQQREPGTVERGLFDMMATEPNPRRISSDSGHQKFQVRGHWFQAGGHCCSRHTDSWAYGVTSPGIAV
jgi:hypothetical protein